MKLHKLLLSAFISFALIAPAVSAPKAHAVIAGNADSLILEENTEISAELESYAVNLRSMMKARKTSFSFSVPRVLISGQKDADALVVEALKETGNPTEGDYLRWCISGYNFTAPYDSSTDSYNFRFTVSYYTTAEQEKAVDSAVRSMISSLDVGTGSDYEVIKAVYNWVTSKVTYEENDTSLLVFTAYGAAVQHRAVCQGYSVLMYRVLTELGIPCRVIPGTGNGQSHAWNIAAVDGKYYYLDSAWDSSTQASGYCYLLRGTNDLDSLSKSNSHSRTWNHKSSLLYADYDDGTFNTRYPVQTNAYTFKPDTISYKLGDVNNDSKIDSKDASLVLLAYSKLSTFGWSGFTASRKNAADVIKDSKVDSKDASALLGYYSYCSTGGRGSLTDYLNK